MASTHLARSTSLEIVSEIVSEIVANVLSIDVALGDRVEAGDTVVQDSNVLVVLE